MPLLCAFDNYPDEYGEQYGGITEGFCRFGAKDDERDS